MLIINTLLLEAGEKFNYVPLQEEEASGAQCKQEYQ